MKLKWILLGLVVVFGSSSLHAQKKKKKKSRQTNITVAKPKEMAPKLPVKTYTSLPLCNNDFQFPYWQLAIVKDFVFPANMQAPSQYRLTTITDTLLNQYLKAVPYDFQKEKPKKIQLPLFKNGLITCKDYCIERVITMDSALQAKYPQLMSFKAWDPNNKLNTARIDCDSLSTKVMIRDEDETYFITPVVFQEQTFYACYAKKDPNFKKDDFEKNKR